MSYRVYTTDGLILKSRDKADNDKLLSIYTKTFGRLEVRAQALRKRESKLRFGLQPYSLSQVSLVQGKAGWRLVGSRPKTNYYLLSDKKGKDRISRITLLFIHFVAGQRPNRNLFLILQSTYNYVSTQQEMRKTAETLFVLRLLFQLGYLKHTNLFSGIATSTTIDKNVLKQFSVHKKEAINIINNTFNKVQM